MNQHDQKYEKFALIREMFETVDIIKSLNLEKLSEFADCIKNSKNIFFTGEGSSRIFPSKRAIDFSLKNNLQFNMHSEGAVQAMDYNLKDFTVLAASNSGRTKEVVQLFLKLQKENHNKLFSVVANENTPLQEMASSCVILSCGKENAVAATKSVMEQALVYDIILRKSTGLPMPDLNELSSKIKDTLEMVIPEDIVNILKNASTIYFAGRNNGVAEELTLKTNEITRKKSDYLEGTYAVHGIEEVMNKNEALIIIDPFSNEEEKFKSCLADKIGIPVTAVTAGDSIFPKIKIPRMEGYDEFIQLAAGWNLLATAGVELGINLDMPQRARKIGNEFTA
ncbi:MAG: SIS domain-containing protein [Spirochaetes bacterium]|nr:SIS domain-containing protein [Spirochaetota bacterium]